MSELQSGGLTDVQAEEAAQYVIYKASAAGAQRELDAPMDELDGEPVEIDHDVRPAVVAGRERDLFDVRQVVPLRALPIDRMHRLVCLPRRHLHRHAVAQQLVDAQFAW
jgi:hypothetical protein